MKRLIIIGAAFLLFACTDKSFERGLKSFNEHKLNDSKHWFSQVRKSDENYQNALSYIEKIDSIQAANKEAEKLAEKEKAEKEFKDLISTFRSDDIWNQGQTAWVDVEGILTSVMYFDDLSRYGKRAMESDDPEVVEMGKYMVKNLPRIQSRDFPVMRKEYGRILRAKLWRDNVELKIQGNRNTTIVLIAGFFASNANIEDSQKAIKETLEKLRFKQSHYKWIPSAREYTYYKVTSKDDTDIN